MDPVIAQLLQTTGLSCDDLLSKLQQYKSLTTEQKDKTQRCDNITDEASDKPETYVQNVNAANSTISINNLSDQQEYKSTPTKNEDFKLSSTELHYKAREVRIDASNNDIYKKNYIREIDKEFRCTEELNLNNSKSTENSSSEDVAVSETLVSSENKKCNIDLSNKKYLRIKPIEQLCNLKTDDNKDLNMGENTNSTQTNSTNSIDLENRTTETKRKTLLDYNKYNKLNNSAKNQTSKNIETTLDTHASFKDHDYGQTMCSRLKLRLNSDEDSLSSSNDCDIEQTDETTDMLNSAENLRDTIRQQLVSLRNKKKSSGNLAEIRNKRCLFSENLKKKRKPFEIQTSMSHALYENTAGSVIEPTANNSILDKLDYNTPSENSLVSVNEGVEPTDGDFLNENIFWPSQYHHKKRLDPKHINFLQVNRNISENFDNDPGIQKTVKNTEKSPFVSNSLDNFLNESAELQVSYPIPKLGAEDGIKDKNMAALVDTIQKPEQRSRSDSTIQKNSSVKGQKLFKAKTVAEMRRQIELSKKKTIKMETKPRKKNVFGFSKSSNLDDAGLLIVKKEVSTVPKNRRTNYILHNKKKVWVSSNSTNPCLGIISNLPKAATLKRKMSSNEKESASSVKENPKKLRRPSILSNPSTPIKKARSKYKPGPLSKKPQLQNFHKDGNWKTEIKKMPTIILELRPELNKAFDSKVLSMIPIFEDTKISTERAEFALSTLCIKKKSLDQPKVFKCDLKYTNNQAHVIVRKRGKSNKIEKVEDDADSVDIISKVVNNIVSYVETKLIENLIVKDDDYDFTQAEKKSPKRPKVKRKRVDRELRRLNCKVIDVATNEDGENKECFKSYCKLGCVCKSLQCQSSFSDHCQLVDCMFECKCKTDNSRVLTSRKDTLSSQVITNLDDRAKRNLAKVEREFTQTIIHTGGDVILVGTGGRDKRRRESKMPLKFTDYIGDPAEGIAITVSPENYSLNIKPCSVTLEKINLNSIVPYCLVHRKLDCECNGQSTYIREKYKESTLSDVEYVKNKRKTKKMLKSLQKSDIKRKVNDEEITIENVNENNYTKSRMERDTCVSPQSTQSNNNNIVDVGRCARVKPMLNEYRIRYKEPTYNKRLWRKIYRFAQQQYLETIHINANIVNHTDESKPNRRKQSFEVRDDNASLNRRKQSFEVRDDNASGFACELKESANVMYNREFAMQRRKAANIEKKYSPVFDGEIKINLKNDQNLLNLPCSNIAGQGPFIRMLPWSRLIKNFQNGDIKIWTRDKPDGNCPEIIFNSPKQPKPKDFVDIRNARYKSEIVKWILEDFLPSGVPRQLMNLVVQPRDDHFLIAGHILKETHNAKALKEVSVERETSNSIPIAVQPYIDDYVSITRPLRNQRDNDSSVVSSYSSNYVHEKNFTSSKQTESTQELVANSFKLNTCGSLSDKNYSGISLLKKSSQGTSLSNSGKLARPKQMNDLETSLNKVSPSSVSLSPKSPADIVTFTSKKCPWDRDMYTSVLKKKPIDLDKNVEQIPIKTLSSEARIANHLLSKQLQKISAHHAENVTSLLEPKQQSVGSADKGIFSNYMMSVDSNESKGVSNRSRKKRLSNVKKRFISLLKKKRRFFNGDAEIVPEETQSTSDEISINNTSQKKQSLGLDICSTNLTLLPPNIKVNFRSVLKKNQKKIKANKETFNPLLLSQIDATKKNDVLSSEQSQISNTSKTYDSEICMPDSTDEEDTVNNNESLLSLLNERVSDNDIEVFPVKAAVTVANYDDTVSQQLHVEGASNSSLNISLSDKEEGLTEEESLPLLFKRTEMNCDNIHIIPVSIAAPKEKIIDDSSLSIGSHDENQDSNFNYSRCCVNLTEKKKVLNNHRNFESILNIKPRNSTNNPKEFLSSIAESSSKEPRINVHSDGLESETSLSDFAEHQRHLNNKKRLLIKNKNNASEDVDIAITKYSFPPKEFDDASTFSKIQSSINSTVEEECLNIKEKERSFRTDAQRNLNNTSVLRHTIISGDTLSLKESNTKSISTNLPLSASNSIEDKNSRNLDKEESFNSVLNEPADHSGCNSDIIATNILPLSNTTDTLLSKPSRDKNNSKSKISVSKFGTEKQSLQTKKTVASLPGREEKIFGKEKDQSLCNEEESLLALFEKLDSINGPPSNICTTSDVNITSSVHTESLCNNLSSQNSFSNISMENQSLYDRKKSSSFFIKRISNASETSAKNIPLSTDTTATSDTLQLNQSNDNCVRIDIGTTLSQLTTKEQTPQNVKSSTLSFAEAIGKLNNDSKVSVQDESKCKNEESLLSSFRKRIKDSKNDIELPLKKPTLSPTVNTEDDTQLSALEQDENTGSKCEMTSTNMIIEKQSSTIEEDFFIDDKVNKSNMIVEDQFPNSKKSCTISSRKELGSFGDSMKLPETKCSKFSGLPMQLEEKNSSKITLSSQTAIIPISHQLLDENASTRNALSDVAMKEQLPNDKDIGKLSLLRPRQSFKDTPSLPGHQKSKISKESSLKKITVLNNTLLVPPNNTDSVLGALPASAAVPSTIKSSVAKCISDSSQQIISENSEDTIKLISTRSIKCTHKDKDGVTQTLILTNKKFDKRAVYMTESEKEDEILLPLPKVSKKMRWRMIYLKSDFSFLLFLSSYYSIKYTDLMDVVNLAKKAQVTMILRNLEFTHHYKHPNFGIFCVPDYADRLFIGPFGCNERHNIEALRYKQGKLVSTSKFAELNRIAVENVPRWVFGIPSNAQAMIDITKDDEDVTDELSDEKYTLEESSLLCKPFVEKLTKSELARKRVNRYIFTNIPHLGYFEAYQTNGKMIEIYWPQATKAYRFPSLPFAKHALILYLSQMFRLIPYDYRIDVIMMTTLSVESYHEVLLEYLEKPKSFICGEFGIHAVDAIPLSVLASFKDFSKEELRKQDESRDEMIEDQLIHLFGLYLMGDKQLRSYPEPNDILKWAKNQIDEEHKMSRKYDSRKSYLQKIIERRNTRVVSALTVMPQELETSLKEMFTHDTIEILDSDDDNGENNDNTTVTKEAPEVSSVPSVTNSTIATDCAQTTDENRSLLEQV